MATVRPLREEPREPAVPALGDRAFDNLRFIRETMERATPFTAISGAGMAASGAVALATAAATWGRPLDDRWVKAWLCAAVAAAATSGAAIVRKARRAETPLMTGAGRKLFINLLPAMCIGALLTIALERAGVAWLLPGTWLLLYGAAVVAGGAHSVRSIPVMGVCFLALGTVALFAPSAWANGFMMAGFGATHVAFGTLVARRYGG